MARSELPLKVTHPDVAAEADGWDPESISAGSGKKLSWKCSKGHKWEAIVGNRTKRNDNCPYCSGKRAIKGETDLGSLFPELARQANGWDPTEITAGSGKKLSWKCQNNHVWSAVVGTRVNGIGCPFCSGFYAIPGETDLATTHPELAKEAFGWDPSLVKAGSSGKKYRWKCGNDHVFESDVVSRTSQGNGCQFCSGHRVLPGFNDLLTTHPHLALELVDGSPNSVSKGSDKKFTWRCSKNHLYKASVSARSRGGGCPVCHGLQVQVGFNDLATTNPALAAEADGWDPTHYTAGSTSRKMNWKCNKGHTWKAAIGSRNLSGAGCPKCSGRDVIIGENDLKTLFPEVALQADGWDPTSVMAGSGKKLKWKCKLGHKWIAQVGSRSFQGAGCPVCSNQITVTGINDMGTTNPKMASEAFGWDPSTTSAGSNLKLEWKCFLGHVWKTSPNKRRSEDSGCPFCSGRNAWPGFNDLQTLRPDIAKQAFEWDPSTQTVGSGAKVFWKCEEGHTWKAAIYSRTGGNNVGCPSCAQSGFDQNKDGYIYFLEHPLWNMYQIGITNDPDRRIATHKRRGWEIIDIRGPMDGLIAQEWETDLLRFLKKSGAKLGPKEVVGKFDGYSEAWIKDNFEVVDLRTLMQLVRDLE
jgi:hypothetical protein